MSSPNGPTEAADGLSPIMRRRLQDREEWAAFWKIRELDAKGKIVPTVHYYAQRYLIDWPVTFVREKLIEPLNDRFRKPYYHRKLTRVPDIDQCGVNDKACIYEANEQFRLDKLVDTYIMNILKIRTNRCITYHDPYLAPCAPLMEEFEEAELNWFIKYGELGSEAEAVDEHKEKLRQGVFDQSFWKKGLIYMDKKLLNPPYDYQPTKIPFESDQPLSKDWAYYKKLQEDPEFDKQQGKQSNIPLI
ncbi:NADH dehydrogenase [ubiquinone] 1 beta subcomplex subunit 10 [Aphelenchoides fujianensis]|nr:NADH dehydrogenase [ubiquinone] 1 beta subcomplex subunit 10 [Aphelenchoides fujianensis]